jgi:hypothetical protein
VSYDQIPQVKEQGNFFELTGNLDFVIREQSELATLREAPRWRIA